MQKNKNLPKGRPGGQGQNGQPPLILKQTLEQSYQGPVPHPSILRDLDEIVPGSAKAIIETYTTEVAHRQQLEAKAVGAEITERNRGQWMAFLIMMALIAGSFSLIVSGNEVGGFVSLFVSIAAAAVTLYTRKSKS